MPKAKSVDHIERMPHQGIQRYVYFGIPIDLCRTCRMLLWKTRSSKLSNGNFFSTQNDFSFFIAK